MRTVHFSLILVALIGLALSLSACKGGGAKKDGCSACGGCGGCGGCKDGCGGCDGGCCGCGGCGGAAGKISGSDKAAAMRLYGQFRSWRKANGESQKSKSHGNTMVDWYVSPLADPVFRTGKIAYSAGMSLAKTGKKNGKLAQVWLMEKRPTGYDSGNGDWFYATFNGAGKLQRAGRDQMCIGCHATAANDYVFGYPPKKG